MNKQLVKCPQMPGSLEHSRTFDERPNKYVKNSRFIIHSAM